jgi:hypothetical protein
MPSKAKVPVFGKCGHINRQSYGIDRKPSNLTCELADGHEGPHQANYERLEKAVLHDDANLTGKKIIKQNGVEYIAVPDVTTWEDVAGEYPTLVEEAPSE